MMARAAAPAIACMSQRTCKFTLDHQTMAIIHHFKHCQCTTLVHRASPFNPPAAAVSHAATRRIAQRCFAAASSSPNAPTSTAAATAAAPTPAAASTSKQEGRPLDACIGPGLQLMEQQFSVAGRVLQLVTPLDVDAVMDMYIAQGIDGDPYWCRVWPSAISLAQQLLQRPDLVAGKSVADLGAGLGVAGIAAALAGAREVVLLDREPLALQCGLISAAASGVKGVVGLEDMQVQALDSSSSSSSSSSASEGSLGAAETAAAHSQQAAPIAELLQLTQLYLQQRIAQQQQQQAEQELPPAPQQPQQQTHSSSSSSSSQSSIKPQQLLLQHQQTQQASDVPFRTHPFDWSSSSIPQRFDVVLACDVLYEESFVEPVAAVVAKLLKPGAGALLLADPPNRTAANRQRFVELLAGLKPAGLRLEESGVYECGVSQLDPEMLGGVTTCSVAVQFMAFRSAVGNDTVGLKLGS